jgi:hypothetical protein
MKIKRYDTLGSEIIHEPYEVINKEEKEKETQSHSKTLDESENLIEEKKNKDEYQFSDLLSIINV